MPGGDLATRFPERMLYGILPSRRNPRTAGIAGLDRYRARHARKTTEKKVNVWDTSSTGRVLDAVSALLGLCRERTYDGEPAMKLESAAYLGDAEQWDLSFLMEGGCEVLSTRSLCREALVRLQKTPRRYTGGQEYCRIVPAQPRAGNSPDMAVHAAGSLGYDTIALSGGVAINSAIRNTIREEVLGNGYRYVVNREYPLGDGCISFGQCICAAKRER